MTIGTSILLCTRILCVSRGDLQQNTDKVFHECGLAASESPESEIGVVSVHLTGSFFVKASLRLVHTGRGHQHPGHICAKTLCKMKLVSETEKDSHLCQLIVTITMLPCAKVLVSEYITISLQKGGRCVNKSYNK